MLTRRIAGLGLFATMITVGVSATSFAGKPTPPPPPAPPVRYEIQFFSTPNGGGYINDFNDQSQAVGWYLLNGRKRAWFYDPSSNPEGVTDLDQLLELYHPDGEPGGAPGGWLLASAVGMNELGAIVGYMERPDDASANPIRQSYMLDLNATDGPKLAVIPDQALGYAYAKDINNHGLVLGTYAVAADLNGSYDRYLYQTDLYGTSADQAVRPLGLSVRNTEKVRVSEQDWDSVTNQLSPAEFAGLAFEPLIAFRYSTIDGGTVTKFPELIGQVSDTTNFGDFCGAAYYTPPKGKKVKVPARVMGSNVQLITSQPGRSASKLNAKGDLVLDNGTLYWDQFGAFSLDGLVTGTPEELATWSAKSSVQIEAINAPISSTFGSAVARIFFPDGSGKFVLLTAVP